MSIVGSESHGCRCAIHEDDALSIEEVGRGQQHLRAHQAAGTIGRGQGPRPQPEHPARRRQGVQFGI